MKLMMNGAVTVGTLDGANVEIMEAVGNDNMYVFGLNTHEVDELWRNGYVAREFYHSSESLHKVIDRFSEPIGGVDFSHIADYLVNGGYGIADPFMCLADFDSYANTYATALKDFSDRLGWAKKSLLNTATSGVFSSDNSVCHYANEIWHMNPVGKN